VHDPRVRSSPFTRSASSGAGDLGTVVELYAPDGLEVEFVLASGKTKALVTLKRSDVRVAADRDVLSVRAS